MKFNNRGQIWVETVIYTLIGLAIIGLLLSIVKPSIERKQDEILIDTTRDMMSSIESSIEEARYYGVGNTRNIDVSIKIGELKINSTGDQIIFSVNSRYKYSQPNEVITLGNLNILTQEKTSTYDVFIWLDYSEILNISWSGAQITQTFQRAPVPHTISATNLGKQEITNLIKIDFS